MPSPPNPLLVRGLILTTVVQDGMSGGWKQKPQPSQFLQHFWVPGHCESYVQIGGLQSVDSVGSRHINEGHRPGSVTTHTHAHNTHTPLSVG